MNQHIAESKKQLRKQIRELKNTVPAEEKLRKSLQVFSLLELRPYFDKCKRILAYWSMPDEVQTRDFIMKWSATKQFYLPVVKNDMLEIIPFQSENDLLSGAAFGIMEPQGNPITDLALIDLVIVPGVAFDFTMNRLGRGKAYYDKLLKDVNAMKTGVCFDFQMVDNVPADVYDVKMDDVIFA